jgi:SET domain-containing protein
MSLWLVFCRCGDANLIDVPVKVGDEDPRLYHVALFAQEDIPAFEELTWDYGCSFEQPEVDVDPLIPFHCKCGSTHCRDTVIDSPLFHHITNLWVCLGT